MARTKRSKTPALKPQRRPKVALGKGQWPPDEDKLKRRRVMMALRVTPALHDEILRRVESTGRSITQEMELLLEQALFTERAIGAPGGKAWSIAHDTMVRMLRAVIDWEWETGKQADIEPLYDPEIYKRAMIYAIEGLAAHWPRPVRTRHPAIIDIDAAINEARERIAKTWKERNR
jgi:hypothetical protein